MSENSGQSKTEAPTQRHRDEARQQGQFALSQDFTNSVQLLAGIAVLWWSGWTMAGGLLEAMRHDLRGVHTFELSRDQVRDMATVSFLQAATLVGPLIGAVFVCVL